MQGETFGIKCKHINNEMREAFDIKHEMQDKMYYLEKESSDLKIKLTNQIIEILKNNTFLNIIKDLEIIHQQLNIHITLEELREFVQDNKYSFNI